MPRNVSVYAQEIDKAIQILRAMNKTIITRRAALEEIENNRSRYPMLGELRGVPLKMVISQLVSRRPDAHLFGKRQVSWVFYICSSSGGIPAWLRYCAPGSGPSLRFGPSHTPNRKFLWFHVGSLTFPACQEGDTISGAGGCRISPAIGMSAELTREHEGDRAVDSEPHRITHGDRTPLFLYPLVYTYDMQQRSH